MKKILLPVLLFCFSLTSAQNILKSNDVTDHSIYIRGTNFEGVIFKKNYLKHPTDSNERKIKRFTPSDQDILIAEKILSNEKKNKQNKGDPSYIFKNLKKYRRQYIGYLNEGGDKIIYINSFLVNEDWADRKVKTSKTSYEIPTWYNELFQVDDGGKSFWQIRINITKKKSVRNVC